MNDNNIMNARIDEDSLTLLTTAFELYNISKSHNSIYRESHDATICKNLIKQYYKLVQPNYIDMIMNFKRKYISNEALVEKNDTPEERKGIALVYDYITQFDVDNKKFYLFDEAFSIHSLLYKYLDEKNASDDEELKNEARKLLEEAKQEKDLKKFKAAREMLSNFSSSSRFGGNLRKGPVVMEGFNASIPDANEACKLFNQYRQPEKVNEYEYIRKYEDIFDYIEYCVKTSADLIALQPFGDGNKRTFRALLNLMFKERNIPPVYFVKKERKPYHDALEKAICNKDYEDLINFYYFKICDSIYALDFKPYLDYVNGEKNKSKVKKIR